MSALIVTSNEKPEILQHNLDSFLNQKITDLIIVSPHSLPFFQNKVRLIKDHNKGKPTALNIVFKKVKSDILILTDGDVRLADNAVENLLKKFNDTVGAVSGKPIPINSKKNLFGYWAHLLTEVGAHRERLFRTNRNEFVPCSGYLYAIRNIIEKIPENSLSDDAIISYKIWQKGYKIEYAPDAVVYVKYPNNWKDWVKQKRRSTAGYVQFKKLLGVKSESRNILREMSRGTMVTLKYAKSIKELAWSFALLFARLFIWILAYWDLFNKKQFKDIWLPVESTK